VKVVEMKHRFTGAVLYTTEVDDGDGRPVRTALLRAIAASADLSSANLSSADLSWANLSSANLSSANLSSANLSSANLSWANLSSANLSWANLSSADLSSANLSWADLSSANLSSADLSSANLSWANLSSANLSWANLSSANLSWVREDLRSRLDRVVAEVPALLDALTAGKINGSVYEGECACFVGTVANVRGCHYEDKIRMADLRPDSESPTEKWFLGIRVGDTPDNSQIAAITSDWICEWLAERGDGPWIKEQS
jgi:hypothetical protein